MRLFSPLQKGQSPWRTVETLLTQAAVVLFVLSHLQPLSATCAVVPRFRGSRAPDQVGPSAPTVSFEWMAVLWSRGMVGHPNLNVRILQIKDRRHLVALNEWC